MVQIANNTPFQVGIKLTTDKTGAELVVAAVKATFKIPVNGTLEISDEQVEVFDTDIPFDTFENSGIKYPADLVPNKQNTDIGFAGSAWSSNGKPVKKLTASIKVGNYQKKVKVTGDRIWNKVPLIPWFYATPPKSFVEMPMTSDKVFGGKDTVPKDEAKHRAYAENQHGTGFFKHRKEVKGSKLPNFENPKGLVNSWRSKPPVGTFGFSPETAKHRRKFAGTYNKKWEETQFPLPPLNFDDRFYNCAQPELIAKGFLNGGEIAELRNLSKNGEIKFLLPNPGFKLKFFMQDNEEIIKEPFLYNVVFEPNEDRFYMSYAVTFDIGNTPLNLVAANAYMDDQTKNQFGLEGDTDV